MNFGKVLVVVVNAFAIFLLAVLKIMTIGWMSPHALKVLYESLGKRKPAVHGSFRKLFEPSQRSSLKHHWEVDCFNVVISSREADGGQVASKPLTQVLLAVIFVDVDGLELLRVLESVKSAGEAREAIY